MNPTYQLIKSRTFWLLVLAAAIPVANAIVPTLPPDWQAVVSVILSFAAMYTHNDTAQKAGAVN